LCGICGAGRIGAAAPIERSSLESMAATIVHRGPDSSGFFVCSDVGLAVRRLAIMDVAGGDQPLANEDGQVRLVCNGEIYNSPSLREELRGLGHQFRTGSDCETIVHAYEEFGDGFLERLNGMFALALWDQRRRRLVLARDRVGIKPLYYAQHEGLLLFGSEAKTLLAYPGFPRALDLVSLDQYLTYEYVPTPRSIFQGVSKLRPGHALAVEDGQVRDWAYWQLDFTPRPPTRPVEDMADELWQTLREAVRRELMSDVPLGVFLSGGIDSSAVAAAMTELGGDVRSFSIGFEDASFDESAYAQQVAQHLGTRHHQQQLKADQMWELVPALADLLDEPFADPSVIPTFLLSRFAREHVTVALGGDGGDELFAGYPTLQAHRLASYYGRLPSPLRDRLIPGLANRLPVSRRNLSLDFKAKRFVAAATHPPAERHHAWMGAFPPSAKPALLTPAVSEALGDAATFDALEEHVAAARSFDETSRILYLDMKMYLEGDILAKVDRASMGCSLEVRVPLLNADLVELATHLPADLKLRRLTRKYLLRKAVAGKLPESIINRPKKGFGIPVAPWLRRELRSLMQDALSEDRLRRQGLFEPAYVSTLVEDHQRGRRDNRKLLWTLLMFQLWHERWLG
jgi:asparagine synthase (glutamine-hydrolysing)